MENPCALHIRGHIKIGRRLKPGPDGIAYDCSVYNECRRRAANTDGCCATLADAMTDCAERVYIARRAYVLGLGNYKLDAP